MRRALLFSSLGLLALACAEAPAASEDGERVTPPFEVRGEVEGLLLVWFDEEGPHTAASRSEIPEGHRAFVRVEDLSRPPGEGPGPGQVFVADLRRPGEGGRYPVRRMSRAAFDARVAAAAAVPEPRGEPPEAGGGGADVVVYGASWCGACRSTAAFLRERNVEFVERDIEREPGARQAMLEAASAAGVRPTGIPVIDFRGTIITGFDRAALERAIERSRSPI